MLWFASTAAVLFCQKRRALARICIVVRVSSLGRGMDGFVKKECVVQALRDTAVPSQLFTTSNTHGREEWIRQKRMAVYPSRGGIWNESERCAELPSLELFRQRYMSMWCRGGVDSR